MTALVHLNGTPNLPVSVRLTTTARTDVYTNGNPAGSKQLEAIHSIAIANEGATGKKILLEWTNDGVTFYLLFRTTIPADDSLREDMPGIPLVLKAGAKLTATAETGNFLTVTVASTFLG
jgi:hypothetical protein